jgi:cohesin loading factor subunit SCC2
VLFDDIFRNLSAVLPLAADLVRLEDMPEAIVIPAVVVSIGPFFVDAAQPAATGRKGKGRDTFGITTLKTVQLSALTLLRAVRPNLPLDCPARQAMAQIFSKYPNQRAWIIEETVNSLTKLSDVKKAKRQFRLRSGGVIHNVSALLLHLIQSTAHGVEQQVQGQLGKVQVMDEDQGEREYTHVVCWPCSA